MSVGRALWTATALCALGCAGGAQAACKIAQIAEWHVDRIRNRPSVDGQINGQPVRILIDTGTEPFAIGDEIIRNAKLRIGDLYILGSRWHRVMDKRELILGDDFLLAHRVVVQPREHVMVFSYNGGPVFQLIHPGEAAQVDPTAEPAVVPAESAAKGALTQN
jgi:hypothetical protein